MNELVLARVLHVLGVVLWIGGVAMVTTVILPAVQRLKSPQERVEFFEKIEHRFAWQARATTLLTGITGFYLLHQLDGWSRLAIPAFWYFHAMIAVWMLFTLMLFVLEPLVLRRLFLKYAAKYPTRIFQCIQGMHWVLLVISLITIAGAVAGSHGWLWF